MLGYLGQGGAGGAFGPVQRWVRLVALVLVVWILLVLVVQGAHLFLALRPLQRTLVLVVLLVVVVLVHGLDGLGVGGALLQVTFAPRGQQGGLCPKDQANGGSFPHVVQLLLGDQLLGLVDEGSGDSES